MRNSCHVGVQGDEADALVIGIWKEILMNCLAIYAYLWWVFNLYCILYAKVAAQV